MCLALCKVKVSKKQKIKDTRPTKDYFKLREKCPLNYYTISRLLDTNYMADCAGHHKHI